VSVEDSRVIVYCQSNTATVLYLDAATERNITMTMVVNKRNMCLYLNKER